MELSELSWPDVAKLSKDTPVVFPVAALEQHGHHLPVFTDSLLLGEIVRRAKERVGIRVLFAPLMWLGNSDHHMDFPGTLSASPRVYLDLLSDLAQNFIQHGFKRIVFLNGHGGNDVPGKQAVFEIRQRHRYRDDLLLVFATYWNLESGSGGPKPALPAEPAAKSDFVQSEMGHACEWETSMILRLNPRLVGDYQKTDTVDPGTPFTPAFRGWTTKERSQPGHIGQPQFASAEKGEMLFQRFADDAVAFLERVVAWDGKSWSG